MYTQLDYYKKNLPENAKKTHFYQSTWVDILDKTHKKESTVWTIDFNPLIYILKTFQTHYFKNKIQNRLCILYITIWRKIQCIHSLVLLWSKRYVNSIQYVHIKSFMANAIASYAIKYTLFLKRSKFSQRLSHYFRFIHIVVFIFLNIDTDSLYIWQSPIIFFVMFTSENSFGWREFLINSEKKYCYRRMSDVHAINFLSKISMRISFSWKYEEGLDQFCVKRVYLHWFLRGYVVYQHISKKRL